MECHIAGCTEGFGLRGCDIKTMRPHKSRITNQKSNLLTARKWRNWQTKQQKSRWQRKNKNHYEILSQSATNVFAFKHNALTKI